MTPNDTHADPNCHSCALKKRSGDLLGGIYNFFMVGFDDTDYSLKPRLGVLGWVPMRVRSQRHTNDANNAQTTTCDAKKCFLKVLEWLYFNSFEDLVLGLGYTPTVMTYSE